MSFILDALRKSESERRREVIPDITRIPLAPARLGLPAWVVPVTTGLAVAVIGLAAAWWYTAQSSAARGDEAPAAARDEPGAAAAGLPVDEARAPLTASATPDAGRKPEGPSPSPAGPAASRPLPIPDPASARAALAEPAGPGPATAALPAPPTAREDRIVPLSELAAPPSLPATDAETDSAGSAARAVEARAEPPEPVATLPRFSDLRAAGVALPDLELELHVYSATPSRRFVFVNGGRYAEGGTLPGGQEVVRITPDGAVLSDRGRRFLLVPD